ncbi:hypothetical protein G4B88_008189 [Cannabis sativa]|uniref:Reverse transcriptase zinc-binding domain-containing protein n=1 Tax=Cannabis sativa TaxID=3483 RepID=A0A7J6ETI7_CANSA|nr:hypothetical protein G4B88_008189 [Cannabis sativa]
MSLQWDQQGALLYVGRLLCCVLLNKQTKTKLSHRLVLTPPDRPWLLIGTYGPPTTLEKEVFWDELGDFICQCTLPLIIMGDLNGTLKDNECLNYSKANNIARYSFDLRRMVLRSGLIDLGFIGTRFTWFRRNANSTTTTSLKRARLDRAMGTADWRVNWPNAIVQHLQAAVSDHNPIMLDTNGGRKCTKPQFKYEVMWERDPRVFWVVINAWHALNHPDPMVNMYRKMKHTKDQLSKWNKFQFRKLSVQIEEARANLKGDFINENLIWNEQRIREWFGTVDAKHILNIALPAARKDDSWMWLGETSGQFSIKSAYHLVKNGPRSLPPTWQWKLVWNTQMHTRLKILCWQILRDALPTRAKLGQFMALPSVYCPLCNDEEETSIHLFWNLPNNLDFDTFLIGALCIIEVIWNNRNKVIHETNSTPLNEVIGIVRRQFHDHSSARQPLSKIAEISATPPTGWLACNTDVSIDADQSYRAAVLRDSSNRIQAIYSIHLSVTNPTLAEALTIVSAAEFGRIISC